MRLLNTAVLVVACAASAAAQATQPLEASLRRGFNEPLFRVNQPAFVAVFEVLPGLGVQQIFPRSGRQAAQLVEPGEYLLSRPFSAERGYDGWSRTRPYARPMYVVQGDGRVNSFYYATAWSGPDILRPGRTILMVASKTPLRRVASPEAANSWLQQVVGFRAIANSISAPDDMLTDIVAAILPMNASVDDVVVDQLVVYDQDIRAVNPYGGRTISFNCLNGIYTIPAEFFFDSGMFRCPEVLPTNRVSQVPPTPPVPVEATTITRPVGPVFPLDNEEYKVPGRKRPVDGWRNGLDLGGTNGLDQMTRSTITVNEIVPITYDGNTRGGVNPATGAWVPPSPSVTPGDYGWGAGRFTPGASDSRQGSSGRAAGEGAVASGTAPSPSSSAPANTPTPSPAASPSTTSGSGLAPGSAGARAAAKPIDP